MEQLQRFYFEISWNLNNSLNSNSPLNYILTFNTNTKVEESESFWKTQLWAGKTYHFWVDF